MNNFEGYNKIQYATNKTLKDIAPKTWKNKQSLVKEMKGYMIKLLQFPNTKPYAYHAIDLMGIKHGVDLDFIDRLIRKHEKTYDRYFNSRNGID